MIKFFDLSPDETHKHLVQSVSPMSKIHFKLALGDPLTNHPSTIAMFPLEQEKNKKGVYQLIFDLKKEVVVKSDDILFHYEITCTLEKNKMMIGEEEFRRIIQ